VGAKSPNRADITAELTFVKSLPPCGLISSLGGGGTRCFVPAFFAQLPWRPSEGDIDGSALSGRGLPLTRRLP
jgi:hypothetical protein